MYNNWCNGQVCPRYESSQNLVHIVCIEDKISGLYPGYGGYMCRGRSWFLCKAMAVGSRPVALVTGVEAVAFG
jgi:hypothetical protein